MKKKLGIIGGMGSHAATWLFKRIVDLSYGQKDQEYIEILLHNNTAIPDRTRAIVYNEDSPLPELLRSVELFNSSGVEVAVMACLTAYHYKTTLAESFSGEFIDPVAMTVALVKRHFPEPRGLRVGVIASTGALRSGLFQRALTPLEVEVVTLDSEDQEQFFMRPIYMEGGAKSGSICPEATELFEHQVPLLKRKGADMIIGACSEVPLLLSEHRIDMPYIDVFDRLARRVVDTCYCVA